MPLRFVCLRVAHLPVLVEDLHSPGLIQQPCVIVRAWDGRVLDASPAALASGVGIGDSRTRVEQLCPQATILPARETLYQVYHDRLKAVLSTFSAAIETADLGEFFIEAADLARTFPSAQALGQALVTQASQVSGLPAVAGIAANKFTAQQAATQAGSRSPAPPTRSAAPPGAARSPTPPTRSAAPPGAARPSHAGSVGTWGCQLLNSQAELAGTSGCQPLDDDHLQGHPVCVVPHGQERAFLAPLPLAVLPQPPAELLRRLYLFGITTLGDFARLPRSAIAHQFGASQVVFYELAGGSDPRPLVPTAPPPIIHVQRQLPEPLDNRQLLLAILERLAAGLARHLSHAGYHAMALALVVTTVDGQELTRGTTVKPPSSDPALLERLAGRLLGWLAPSSAVAGLALTAYPLREWHLGAQQLTLVDEPAVGKWQRLQATLRALWQRFGSAMIRLASTVGPPLPIPLDVQIRPDGTPLVVRWGGWGRLVDEVHEYWREERQWWDQALHREYFQVITEGDTILTLFRDENERWFLDRRRV